MLSISSRCLISSEKYFLPSSDAVHGGNSMVRLLSFILIVFVDRVLLMMQYISSVFPLNFFLVCEVCHSKGR